ncbi:laccase [Gallibacterium salpingitidis]|uniref:Purine nucleoside phosphorylase n=1 Tax=Gallibacterium salpingitidis TaxID=505341 RepID=A0AB36E2Z4_9PAST|nr:peptidoglycan editing factor PgeF [Gallibacterium salpingitidis]OBX09266.1 laccase [Gallibacterium salpingitidis]OBX10663.1 laccase [Gallibacterium salpingitidis]WKT00237.1 peptidoglycan editing factor PgeF [Gallibacterium salpingitidis]
MKALYPNWQVPSNVHALSTLRAGGHSCGVFAGLNLGDHVGDDPALVQQNRQQLVEQFHLPQTPIFLTQVHGTAVKQIHRPDTNLTADACYTNQANHVCLIMTADCLPVVFATDNGTEVAAAHAGWRGLAAGVLENTLAQFSADPATIKVWLAPAIGAQAFQVGEDVFTAFCQQDPNAQQAFKPDPQHSGKYFADIYQLARLRLQRCGILPQHISGGEYCTYSDPENFYSYRRDGQTGRMATLIWFSEK